MGAGETQNLVISMRITHNTFMICRDLWLVVFRLKNHFTKGPATQLCWMQKTFSGFRYGFSLFCLMYHYSHFFSCAVSRYMGAAIVCLAWLSSTLLYWVVSCFLVRLVEQKCYSAELEDSLRPLFKAIVYSKSWVRKRVNDEGKELKTWNSFLKDRVVLEEGENFYKVLLKEESGFNQWCKLIGL